MMQLISLYNSLSAMGSSALVKKYTDENGKSTRPIITDVASQILNDGIQFKIAGAEVDALKPELKKAMDDA